MRRLFALLCVAPICVAANAAVINGSFENPVINTPGGVTQDGSVPGWIGITGVWRIPSTNFFEASPPDGLNIGYSNSVATTQQLTNTVLEGVHTATIMAGRRGDGFAGSFLFKMYAGGTIDTLGRVTGGTALAEQLFDHTLVSPNTFTPLSISYTALPGDSLIGQQIIISMEKTAGVQMNFDKVEYTGPDSIPEPTTMLLGLGALAFFRKKRKA